MVVEPREELRTTPEQRTSLRVQRIRRTLCLDDGCMFYLFLSSPYEVNLNKDGSGVVIRYIGEVGCTQSEIVNRLKNVEQRTLAGST